MVIDKSSIRKGVFIEGATHREHSEANLELDHAVEIVTVNQRRKPSQIDQPAPDRLVWVSVQALKDFAAVSIYCWRQKNGGADFHARYLLTECGGVGIDAGFSAEGGHQTTDMHLMSVVLSQARLTAFARHGTDFELVEPVLEIRSDGSVRRT